MPDEATIKRWIAKYGAFVIVAILGGIAQLEALFAAAMEKDL